MVIEKEHLIELEVRTDRLLRRVQGLPAEWQIAVKRRVVIEVTSLIPIIQKKAIKLIEEKAQLVEKFVKQQAQQLEEAWWSFKVATSETFTDNLKDWKQELGLL